MSRGWVAKATTYTWWAYTALGVLLAVMLAIWGLSYLPGWVTAVAIVLCLMVLATIVLLWSRQVSARRTTIKISIDDETLRLEQEGKARQEELIQEYLKAHGQAFRTSSSGLEVPTRFAAAGNTSGESSSEPRDPEASPFLVQPEHTPSHGLLRRHLAANKDLYEFAALVLPLISAAATGTAWLVANLYS